MLQEEIRQNKKDVEVPRENNRGNFEDIKNDGYWLSDDDIEIGM